MVGWVSVAAVEVGVPVVLVQDDKRLTVVKGRELTGFNDDEIRTEELHVTKPELGVAEAEGNTRLELGITAPELPPAMRLYGVTPGKKEAGIVGIAIDVFKAIPSERSSFIVGAA